MRPPDGTQPAGGRFRSSSHRPMQTYALTVDKLVPLERIGERSAQMLVAAVEGSKAQPLWRALVGLGINHVGPTAAREPRNPATKRFAGEW